MGHTIRQFKALTKKNFISYVRQPGCAVFQLLCPGMLMLLLVWIRTKITVKTPPYINYEAFKRPFFPGLEYQGASQWLNEPVKTSAREELFMLYDNYTDGGVYSTLTDFEGPLFFFPTQCEKQNSVIIPRVPSWVIAVVGQKNPV